MILVCSATVDHIWSGLQLRHYCDSIHFNSSHFYVNLTSNVTSVNEVRSVSTRLFAGMWRPLVSVILLLQHSNVVFFIVVLN